MLDCMHTKLDQRLELENSIKTSSGQYPRDCWLVYIQYVHLKVQSIYQLTALQVPCERHYQILDVMYMFVNTTRIESD